MAGYFVILFGRQINQDGAIDARLDRVLAKGFGAITVDRVVIAHQHKGRVAVALTQAAHHVVPVAVTAAEQVERLRQGASGRCLNASAPGIYRRHGEGPARPGRRVQRGHGDN